jgi:hypothetical protein
MFKSRFLSDKTRAGTNENVPRERAPRPNGCKGALEKFSVNAPPTQMVVNVHARSSREGLYLTKHGHNSIKTPNGRFFDLSICF